MYPYQNKATIWIKNGFTNISVKHNFGAKNARVKTSIAINLAFGPKLQREKESKNAFYMLFKSQALL